MESTLILLPLVLVLVTLLYGVLYALIRAWLDYRFRMALLDRVDHNPDLLGPREDLYSVLHFSDATSQAPSRQNYVLTGLLIICIGLGCVLFGRALRVGEVAVGTYLGGVFCFILGIVLAGLGGIIRLVSRDPLSRLRVKPPSSNL